MSGQKPPDGDDKPEDRRSGRVTFDERGNAVWEWSMSTGIFGRNVDTKRLKKLEANDLKLAEDPAPAHKAAPMHPVKPAGGFDPYNSSGTAPRAPPGKPVATKPKDLRRLSEWIQLQKTLGKKPAKE
ncbi:MAG: hypothetical protein HC853_03925 [Anaerolineae bacterium]|nr:hypothetical protein [Anaerolineae bacterium]